IVFRELKTGQRVYAAGHDLADPPRDKRVPGCGFLRKRCDQRDRPVKILVAALAKIILRLALFSIRSSEVSQVIVDFPQPPRVRRPLGVWQAQGELALDRLSVTERAGKPGTNDTGEPVQDESLPSG